jgi:non-heme chloroperoxidase
MTDDLAAVIDELGLTSVTLVGFSMGDGEVARYLSRHGAGGGSAGPCSSQRSRPFS